MARRIPSFSTTSPVSRKPAVSVKVIGKPFKLIFSCSTSRVVPAISVTIARSLPANVFNSDDLPALGLPAITTCKPSRNS